MENMALKALFGMDTDQDLLAPQTQKSSFKWATVTGLSPLAIRLDNSPQPLNSAPVNLAGGLSVGDRVWAQIVDRRVVILGKGGAGDAPPRIPLDSTLTWGTVANEFTIRRDGYWREIRGAITGNLPTGTTAITNWWALDVEDRPSRNAFSYAYLGGNHAGAFLARPDGQMALINQSGAARSGDHQFTLVYSVD